MRPTGRPRRTAGFRRRFKGLQEIKGRHRLSRVADDKRRILTGEDVQSIPEGGILDITPGTLLTDIAREWVERRKIRIVERMRSGDDAIAAVKLAIGSDHGGFEMKSSLREYLDALKASYIDYGTRSKRAVDYPDIAHAVALSVALGQAKQGIIIDGAGIGSAIVANKVPGIRAAACYEEAGAMNAREHNDINVLTLGSTLMLPEKLRPIVRIFISAEHREPRHKNRVAKIMAVEKKYYRPV